MESGEDGWPLFIPAIGPFIMAARLLGEDNDCDPMYEGDCDDVDDEAGVGGAFSILAGLMQVAGIAMLTAGYVRRSRARRLGVATDSPHSRQVALLPGGPGDGPGLSLAGTF
jgi:hypothetical protein